MKTRIAPNTMSLVLSLILCASAAVATDVTVDFAKTTGKVNPQLLSSGCAPRLCPRAIRHDDADIKAMGCYATHTHDWALWNAGQRIVMAHAAAFRREFGRLSRHVRALTGEDGLMANRLDRDGVKFRGNL